MQTVKLKVHWEKVEPKQLHTWRRFMVRKSTPPVAVFWDHFQRWSCILLKAIWLGPHHKTSMYNVNHASLGNQGD